MLRTRYVVDERNGGVQGPFRRGGAEQEADALNQMILRNGGLGFILATGGKVRGPFYPRTKKQLTAGQRREVLRLMKA